MSLVAYTATSSDEDSDCENNEETIAVRVQPNTKIASIEAQNAPNTSKSLKLPQPKQDIRYESDEDAADEIDRLKLELPAPKKTQAIIEECDDEFLRKKVAPALVVKPSQAKPANARQPVKITIPSLSEFKDDDLGFKGEVVSVKRNPQKPNGLLSMLPPPKFEGAFGKPKEKPSSSSSSSDSAPVTKTTSLVPHSVANKMKQAVAEKAKPKPSATVAGKKRGLGLNYNNSDDSDNEDDGSGDFFSLNTEEKLPEVSASEITAMVAKKSNQMAEFSKSLNEAQTNAMEVDDYAAAQPSSSSYVQDTDNINIEALIGARAAKRARKGDIQFIDISQDQVGLSHDEWQRNQLQSETQFVPTGRLNVGEGPGTGTKKKHQITYLAYQAKANEAELQAMWANNRQSRRQTQSKYGF